MLPTTFFGAASLWLLAGAPPAGAAQEQHVAGRAFAPIPGDVEVIGDVVFALDGSTVAYRARRNGDLLAIVDGQLSATHAFVDAPVFGATGAQLIFRVAESDSRRSETWRLLQGGKSVAKSDWIGPPAWSPDGRKLAYWTRPNSKLDGAGRRRGGVSVFVVDGTSGSKWDACEQDAAPIWSSDSKHVATVAQKGDAWSVVLDGKAVASVETSPPRAVDLGPPATSGPWVRDVALSADAAHVAFASYAALDENGAREWRIVHDSTTLRGDYEAAGRATFAPSGERFAYVVRAADKRQGVVLDFGQPTFENGAIVELAFSPSGERLAWTVGGPDETMLGDSISRNAARTLRSSAKRVVLDGQPLGAPCDQVRCITFSPDSKRLAYAAREGGAWSIVCGASKIACAGEPLVLRFSDDGSTVFFGQRDRDALGWFAVSVD